MKRPRVFVIGSYMNAHFFFVDRLPSAGQSVAAERLAHSHGGKGLNVALALHRLNMHVDMLLMLGGDEAGDAVIRLLSDHGLPDGHVRRVDGASGYGVGLIDTDGQNMLTMYAGANARLDAAVVESAADTIGNADWVTGQFEVPDEGLIAAFRIARQAGRNTLLNPSPWRAIAPDLLALSTHLIMNDSEAAAFLQVDLAGAPAAHWAKTLESHPARTLWAGRWLIVTLAERGSIAVDPAGTVVIGPPFAITLVDATGAGDAFAAGYIAAAAQNLPDAFSFANACGALVAAKSGVLDALPDTATVERFRATQPRIA